MSAAAATSASVHLHALGIRFLVDGESTGGAFALVEYQLPPRSLGAPIHTHHGEDEYSYVAAGRPTMQLGDEIREFGPGELVAKPRGVPHAFWNADDTEARVLELISPAGFENYFRELAPLLAAGDQCGIRAVVERYDLEIDHSTIPALIEKHALQSA
jgi:quercetin dioxygenase-like cupin family protein